jgi:hypothetical protein
MRTRFLALLLLVALAGCKTPYRDANRFKDQDASEVCVTARNSAGTARDLLNRCVDIANKDAKFFDRCGGVKDVVRFRQCALKERCFSENERYELAEQRANMACHADTRMVTSR